MLKNQYETINENGQYVVYRNIPSMGKMMVGSFSKKEQAESFIRELRLHEKEFKNRLRFAIKE